MIKIIEQNNYDGYIGVNTKAVAFMKEGILATKT